MFTFENQTVKVELTKNGDLYCLEVAMKNEAGEWEVVCQPEVVIPDAEREAVVSVGNATGKSIAITLRIISE